MGLTVDICLLNHKSFLGGTPGQHTFTSSHRVYSIYIMFFCYPMMVEARRAASVFDRVVTGLLSNEPKTQASQGNKNRGLSLYMPQIASVRNQERDGGWQHWVNSRVTPYVDWQHPGSLVREAPTHSETQQLVQALLLLGNIWSPADATHSQWRSPVRANPPGMPNVVWLHCSALDAGSDKYAVSY